MSGSFFARARLHFYTTLIALLCITAASPVLASRDIDDEHRTEFYGIIEQHPQNGLHGEWMIGGRTFITDRVTEFDVTEGPLSKGSCAKVEFRSGRVHEIDSEPMHDCQ